MANATANFGTRIQLEGDNEHKQSLSEISRGLQVLKSDLKATESGFGDQAGSIDALTSKSANLQQQYDLQAQKVELMTGRLEAAKEKYGENSAEADKLQIALNNAKTAMNNTANELDSAITKLDAAKTAQEGAADGSSALAEATECAKEAVEDEGEAADDAEEKHSRLAGAMGKVGNVAKAGLEASLKAVGAAFAAVGTAAFAATGEVYQFAKDAGTMADNVITLSVQTGVSAKELQGWSYAANFIDTDVDTITKSMARMTKTMGEAAGGSDGAKDKFKALGVSIKDSNGNLRDSQDVFADCIDALGNIENETKRDALAMELFGKSAQDLNPLIEAGGQALSDMCDEAAEMGTVFGDDALSAMGAFDDSMQRFNATGTALKQTIGLVCIPAFKPLVDSATKSMAKVSKALQDGLQPEELGDLMTAILNDLGGVLTQITDIVGEAVPILSDALTTLIVSLAESLPGLADVLLPAAFDLLQGVVDAIASSIAPLAGLATDITTSLATFIIDNLPLLMDAAVGIVAGLVDGITQALPELIPAAIEMMVHLAAGLIDAIPTLLAAIPQIFAAVWDGLCNVDWTGLGSTLVQTLGSAISAAGEALTGLWDWLTSTFDADGNGSVSWSEAGGRIVGWLNDGLAAAGAAITDLWGWLTAPFDENGDGATTWDEIGGKIFGWLEGGLKKAIEAVTGLWTWITGFFTDDTETGTTKFEGFGSSIITWIGNGIKALLEGVTGIFSWIMGMLGGDDSVVQAETFSGFGSSIITWIGNGVKSLISGVTGFFDWVLSLFGGGSEGGGLDFSGIMQSFIDFGASLIGWISDGISGVIGAIGSVWDWIMGLFGGGGEGESQTSDAEAIGTELAQGIASGLKDDGTLSTAITEIASTILDQLKSQLGVTEGASTVTEGYGMLVMTGMANGLSGEAATGSVTGAVSTLVAALLGQLDTDLGTSEGSDSTQAQTRGGSVAGGLGSGMTDAQALVTAAATTVAQAVIAQYDADLGIVEGADSTYTVTDGGSVVSGLASGMTGMQETAIAAATTVAEATLAELASALGVSGGEVEREGGGSTKSKPYGEGVAVGVANGLSAKGVASTYTAAANAVQSGVKSAMDTSFGITSSGWFGGSTSSKFEYVGKAVADGIASGIRNNQSVITSAARAAATAAYNAAKAALAIASPSRLTAELGRYFDEGFALGIESGADEVMRSARNLSDMAAGALSADTKASLSVGARGMAIDYDRLARAVRGDEQRGRGDVIIYQTNNSPAALTPYEVARQTRSAARELAAMWR